MYSRIQRRERPGVEVDAKRLPFGFVVLILFAWVLSEDRRALPWRIVVSGALLQIVLAAALLKLPLFRDVFLALNDVLSARRILEHLGQWAPLATERSPPPGPTASWPRHANLPLTYHPVSDIA